jgi:hypothetical protein
MARFTLLTVAICGLVSPAAWAHDVIQPPWRGQDGSTYQEWRFDTNANPAPPEVINNPYGTASAAITVGDFGSGWLDQLGGLGDTQTNYWDLGSAGTIVIDIDNRPEPLPYKEIWIQVTYFQDLWQAPAVDVPGASLLGGETRLIEHVSTGGDWFLDQTMWRIEPNPDHEQITVTADLSGSVIDQIVIDTICIPEPGTLAGLVVGCCLLAVRRRRP